MSAPAVPTAYGSNWPDIVATVYQDTESDGDGGYYNTKTDGLLQSVQLEIFNLTEVSFCGTTAGSSVLLGGNGENIFPYTFNYEGVMIFTGSIENEWIYTSSFVNLPPYSLGYIDPDLIGAQGNAPVNPGDHNSLNTELSHCANGNTCSGCTTCKRPTRLTILGLPGIVNMNKWDLLVYGSGTAGKDTNSSTNLPTWGYSTNSPLNTFTQMDGDHVIPPNDDISKVMVNLMNDVVIACTYVGPQPVSFTADSPLEYYRALYVFTRSSATVVTNHTSAILTLDGYFLKTDQSNAPTLPLGFNASPAGSWIESNTSSAGITGPYTLNPGDSVYRMTFFDKATNQNYTNMHTLTQITGTALKPVTPPIPANVGGGPNYVPADLYSFVGTVPVTVTAGTTGAAATSYWYFTLPTDSTGRGASGASTLTVAGGTGPAVTPYGFPTGAAGYTFIYKQTTISWTQYWDVEIVEYVDIHNQTSQPLLVYEHGTTTPMYTIPPGDYKSQVQFNVIAAATLALQFGGALLSFAGVSLSQVGAYVLPLEGGYYVECVYQPTSLMKVIRVTRPSVSIVNASLLDMTVSGLWFPPTAVISNVGTLNNSLVVPVGGRTSVSVVDLPTCTFSFTNPINQWPLLSPAEEMAELAYSSANVGSLNGVSAPPSTASANVFTKTYAFADWDAGSAANENAMDGVTFLSHVTPSSPPGAVPVAYVDTPYVYAPAMHLTTPSATGNTPYAVINESRRYAIACNVPGFAESLSRSQTGGSLETLGTVLAANAAASPTDADTTATINGVDAVVFTLYTPVVTFANATDRPMWLDGGAYSTCNAAGSAHPVIQPCCLLPFDGMSPSQSYPNVPVGLNIAEIPLADLPAVTVYTDALLAPGPDVFTYMAASFADPKVLKAATTWENCAAVYSYSSTKPFESQIANYSPSQMLACGPHVFSIPYNDTTTSNLSGGEFTKICRTVYGQAIYGMAGNAKAPLCSIPPNTTGATGTPASYLNYAGTLQATQQQDKSYLFTVRPAGELDAVAQSNYTAAVAAAAAADAAFLSAAAAAAARTTAGPSRAPSSAIAAANALATAADANDLQARAMAAADAKALVTAIQEATHWKRFLCNGTDDRSCDGVGAATPSAYSSRYLPYTSSSCSNCGYDNPRGGGVVYVTIPQISILNHMDIAMAVTWAPGTLYPLVLPGVPANGVPAAATVAVSDLPLVRVFIDTGNTYGGGSSMAWCTLGNPNASKQFMFNGDFSASMDDIKTDAKYIDGTTEVPGYFVAADCSNCFVCATDTAASSTNAYNQIPANSPFRPAIDAILPPTTNPNALPPRPVAQFNNPNICGTGCLYCNDKRHPLALVPKPPLVLLNNGGVSPAIAGASGPYAALALADWEARYQPRENQLLDPVLGPSAAVFTTSFVNSQMGFEGAIPNGVRADMVLGSRPDAIYIPQATVAPGGTGPVGVPAGAFIIGGNGKPALPGVPNSLGAGTVLCQTYSTETPLVDIQPDFGTVVSGSGWPVGPATETRSITQAAPALLLASKCFGNTASPKTSPVGLTAGTFYGVYSSVNGYDNGCKSVLYNNFPAFRVTPIPVSVVHVMRPIVVLNNATAFVITLNNVYNTPGATVVLQPQESYTFCLTDYLCVNGAMGWQVSIAGQRFAVPSPIGGAAGSPDNGYYPFDDQSGASGASGASGGSGASGASGASGGSLIPYEKTNPYFLMPTNPSTTPIFFNKRFYLTNPISPSMVEDDVGTATMTDVSIADIVFNSTAAVDGVSYFNYSSCMGATACVFAESNTASESIDGIGPPTDVLVNDTTAADMDTGGRTAVTVRVSFTGAGQGTVLLDPAIHGFQNINAMAIYNPSPGTLTAPGISFQVVNDPDTDLEACVFSISNAAAAWACSISGGGTSSTFTYYCIPTVASLGGGTGASYTVWTIKRAYALPFGKFIIENNLNQVNVLGNVYKGNGYDASSGAVNLTTPPSSWVGVTGSTGAAACIGYIGATATEDTFLVNAQDSSVITSDVASQFGPVSQSQTKTCTQANGVSGDVAGGFNSSGGASGASGAWCAHMQHLDGFNAYSVIQLNLMTPAVTVNGVQQGQAGVSGALTNVQLPNTAASLYGVYLPLSSAGLAEGTPGLPNDCVVYGAGLAGSAFTSNISGFTAGTGIPGQPAGRLDSCMLNGIPVYFNSVDNMTFTVDAEMPLGLNPVTMPALAPGEIALLNTLKAGLAYVVTLYPPADATAPLPLPPITAPGATAAATSTTTATVSSGMLLTSQVQTIPLPGFVSLALNSKQQYLLTTATSDGLYVLRTLVFPVSGPPNPGLSGVVCTPGSDSSEVCNTKPMQGGDMKTQFVTLTGMGQPLCYAVTAPIPVGSSPLLFPQNAISLTLKNDNPFPVKFTKTQKLAEFLQSLYDMQGENAYIIVPSNGVVSTLGYPDTTYTLSSLVPSSVEPEYFLANSTSPSLEGLYSNLGAWNESTSYLSAIQTTDQGASSAFMITCLDMSSQYTFIMTPGNTPQLQAYTDTMTVTLTRAVAGTGVLLGTPETQVLTRNSSTSNTYTFWTVGAYDAPAPYVYTYTFTSSVVGYSYSCDAVVLVPDPKTGTVASAHAGGQVTAGQITEKAVGISSCVLNIGFAFKVTVALTEPCNPTAANFLAAVEFFDIGASCAPPCLTAVTPRGNWNAATTSTATRRRLRPRPTALDGNRNLVFGARGTFKQHHRQRVLAPAVPFIISTSLLAVGGPDKAPPGQNSTVTLTVNSPTATYILHSPLAYITIQPSYYGTAVPNSITDLTIGMEDLLAASVNDILPVSSQLATVTQVSPFTLTVLCKPPGSGPAAAPNVAAGPGVGDAPPLSNGNGKTVLIIVGVVVGLVVLGVILYLLYKKYHRGNVVAAPEIYYQTPAAAPLRNNPGPYRRP